MIWLPICWHPFVWGYVRYSFGWRVFSLPELDSSTWPLTFDGHWSIWFILITTWDNTKGSLIDFLYENPTRNKDSDSSRVAKSLFWTLSAVLGWPSPPYSSGNFQPPTDFTPERHSCRWAVHITWKNNCNIGFLNSILPLKQCGMSLWPHENKSTFYFQNRFFKPTFVKHPWKTNTLLVPAAPSTPVQVEESLTKETAESFNAKLTHDIEALVGHGVYTQKVLRWSRQVMCWLGEVGLWFGLVWVAAGSFSISWHILD